MTSRAAFTRQLARTGRIGTATPAALPLERTAEAERLVPRNAPAGNKYRAVRTEGAGPNGERRTYDSKAEARFADELNRRKAAGLIPAWVPQVSLPCGRDEKGRDVRYRADALEILEVRSDGTFVARLLDKKGMDTPASRVKRAALRALYGLSVGVV